MTPEFRHYRVGILTAASFLTMYYDQPTMAAEMIRDLLQGQSIRTLQRVARAEGLSFPRGFWREYPLRWR